MVRKPLIHVHIADIHFGCKVDPAEEYAILQEQFLARINKIHFDVLAIDGDLFDRKQPASSPAVFFAIRFINQCLDMCVKRGGYLILISGTKSHDADQLVPLFDDLVRRYIHYFHIVTDIEFLYVNGYKILCIPELYGKPSMYYETMLCDTYDMCFMHGTLVGGVYGANKEKLISDREPVFSIDSFSGCRGPIIAGHVHKAMCLNSYMYYVSNPIRYRFGEEEPKGFGVCVSGDMGHCYQFVEIESFRYVTVKLEELKTNDPDTIVKALNNMKANGIDFLRLDMSTVGPEFSQPTIAILEQKFSQDPSISIKKADLQPRVDTTPEIEEKYAGMDFLVDPRISEMEKFVLYVNHCEGREFITVDELKRILQS